MVIGHPSLLQEVDKPDGGTDGDEEQTIGHEPGRACLLLGVPCARDSAEGGGGKKNGAGR